MKNLKKLIILSAVIFSGVQCMENNYDSYSDSENCKSCRGRNRELRQSEEREVKKKTNKENRCLSQKAKNKLKEIHNKAIETWGEEKPELEKKAQKSLKQLQNTVKQTWDKLDNMYTQYAPEVEKQAQDGFQKLQKGATNVVQQLQKKLNSTEEKPKKQHKKKSHKKNKKVTTEESDGGSEIQQIQEKPIEGVETKKKSLFTQFSYHGKVEGYAASDPFRNNKNTYKKFIEIDKNIEKDLKKLNEKIQYCKNNIDIEGQKNPPTKKLQKERDEQLKKYQKKLEKLQLDKLNITKTRELCQLNMESYPDYIKNAK